MTARFDGIMHPSPDVVKGIEALTPYNPFNSSPFVAAQRQTGRNAVALVLRDDDGIVAGCLGYLEGRSIDRRMEIPSAHDVPVASSDAAQSYWRRVMTFCRTHGVVHLDLGSYATASMDLPLLPEQTSRRQRQEHVLDLKEPLPRLPSSHRRNVTRARRLGIRVQRTHDSTALLDHLNLMSASMERRQRRGESVPVVQADSLSHALLASGAAELFQAHDGTSVLSSILVLRAPLGAYYQSAGTSPTGMEMGASHFLVSSVAAILQSEGMHLFNLGGAADDCPGLQRFKASFGTRVVPLEAASFAFGSRGERIARRMLARALSFASLSLRAPVPQHPVIYPSTPITSADDR